MCVCACVDGRKMCTDCNVVVMFCRGPEYFDATRSHEI